MRATVPRHLARRLPQSATRLLLSSFILGVVAVFAVMPSSVAAAKTRAEGTSCSPDGADTCPTTSQDGYVYAYDARTNTFVPVPPSSAGNPSTGATYSYALSPACPQSQPFATSSCVGAQQFCAATGSSGLHEYVWRKQLEPQPTDWTIVGDVCIGALPEPVDAGQVLAGVVEYEQLTVPTPEPTVQPAGGALVNLPVVVSVQDVGTQIMTVREPVPGRLVATPSYAWTFDDGAVLNGAGRSYDGTDPRQSPTHYLAHAYRDPEAEASVALSVTWQATFTAGGHDFAVMPLQMPPIVSRYPVYEAHSVLVNGAEP